MIEEQEKAEKAASKASGGPKLKKGRGRNAKKKKKAVAKPANGNGDGYDVSGVLNVWVCSSLWLSSILC